MNACRLQAFHKSIEQAIGKRTPRNLRHRLRPVQAALNEDLCFPRTVVFAIHKAWSELQTLSMTTALKSAMEQGVSPIL
ncbi:hypothetical protein AXG89_30795 (plasmid) [Burkholderia sp. PAMC 26561]|nr:hypothetical protein AXG89_30795 [Burkholderia sp. PAMC 26561]